MIVSGIIDISVLLFSLEHIYIAYYLYFLSQCFFFTSLIDNDLGFLQLKKTNRHNYRTRLTLMSHLVTSEFTFVLSTNKYKICNYILTKQCFFTGN